MVTICGYDLRSPRHQAKNATPAIAGIHVKTPANPSIDLNGNTIRTFGSHAPAKSVIKIVRNNMGIAQT
jgi:hypothetical protein